MGRVARNLDDLRKVVLGLTERNIHVSFEKKNLTYGIPLPDVAYELLQLGTIEILARSFVDEPLVELDPFQLAKLFLVERAHPQ